MTPSQRLAAARDHLVRARSEIDAALQGNTSRSRANHVRMLHEIAGMLNPVFPYASQAGQDHVIDTALKGKRGGTFVDIGAYDGLTGSNSLFFEKWRGWTGVLVEPVAAQRERAETLRSCPCLPYAIAGSEGEAQFMAITKGYTQMSGLIDSYDPELLSQVRADPRHSEDLVTVQTRTIAQILEEADLPNPDFISLDIEGGELAALEAFDFDTFTVTAWAIENNTGAPDIAKLMRGNGYDLIEFCGPDEIYIRA